MSDDMKSDGFRLSMKMKCSSMLFDTLRSVGFHFLLVKCVLKCGVDHSW